MCNMYKFDILIKININWIILIININLTKNYILISLVNRKKNFICIKKDTHNLIVIDKNLL